MTVDVKHKPLEISHCLKANDQTSLVGTAFCGSSFYYTHCYMWNICWSSIIGLIRTRSKRRRRPLREETLSKWKFILSGNNLKGESAELSWAISALDHIQLIKLTYCTYLWDPHFQLMTYPTAGMDVDWTAANTDVQYDDCLLAIISQKMWHMPVDVTQWCYSDDGALPG